jgi:hypothetical protein
VADKVSGLGRDLHKAEPMQAYSATWPYLVGMNLQTVSFMMGEEIHIDMRTFTEEELY